MHFAPVTGTSLHRPTLQGYVETLQSACSQLVILYAGVRERVENLYFTYLFVLRAALKAAPLLEDIAYDTGFPEEDARTGELVRQLVSPCT